MAAREQASTTENGWPLKRPTKLLKPGRDVWDLCVELAKLDELQPYAVPLATLLCYRIDDLYKINQHCATIPMSEYEPQQSNGSLQRRPIFQHQSEVHKEVVALLRELGMTPAAAAKMRKDAADTSAVTEAMGNLSQMLRR